MTDLQPKLTLYGVGFSPRRAEEATGVLLTYKHEPGEIATTGRHKGAPRPDGGAFLEPPAEILIDDRIKWLIDATERHLAAFREAGVTICKFHLDVLYWHQCNMCFVPEDLARIASLGINFTISCYDKTDQKKPPAHLQGRWT